MDEETLVHLYKEFHAAVKKIMKPRQSQENEMSLEIMLKQKNKK